MRLAPGSYFVQVLYRHNPSASANSAQFALDGCALAPCLNSGVCNPLNASCLCPTATQGPACNVDLCSGVNCVSGGHCAATLSAVAGFGVCACPPGYSGFYCEVSPLSPCSAVCSNGGAVGASCECTCPPAKFWQVCVDQHRMG